jgi:hypothetical protein
MNTPSWSERLQLSIQAQLNPDLLARGYRDSWSADNPTRGFCSIASEVAYFILGGPTQGWVAMVGADPAGGTHWWLERPTEAGRERFDPTAAQYLSREITPPYERGRGGGFMGQRKDPSSPFGFYRRPGLRAQVVLNALLEEFDGQSDQGVIALRKHIGLGSSGETPTDRGPHLKFARPRP